MMLVERIAAVLTDIEYPGIKIRIGEKALGEVHYLQVSCPEGRCNATGEPMAWTGRKWLLSEHMTETEIVWTAFKAILTALEHEAREKFLYRGVAIADSHTDVNALVEMVKAAGTDARSEKKSAGTGFDPPESIT